MENLSWTDRIVSIGGAVSLLLSIINPELRVSGIILGVAAFIIVYIDYSFNKLKEYTKQIEENTEEIKKINERIKIYERLSKIEAKLGLNNRK